MTPIVKRLAMTLVTLALLSAGAPSIALEIVLVPNKLFSPLSEANSSEYLRAQLDQAQESSVVLFFDEADALFGKRSDVKDAHDRYTNVEVNYLLDNLETLTSALPAASSLLVFREAGDDKGDPQRLYALLAADPTRLSAAGARDLWFVPQGRVLSVAHPPTLLLILVALTLLRAGSFIRKQAS